MSACSKIRYIVRLRQMLRRWRKKAAMTARSRVPSDVPSGHVAVIVGANCKRFVVRANYLNHPLFKKLLARAEEEYGFLNSGPLSIPCDETLFEDIICYLARYESDKNNVGCFVNFEDFQRYCHVGLNPRPLISGRARILPKRGLKCEEASEQTSQMRMKKLLSFHHNLYWVKNKAGFINGKVQKLNVDSPEFAQWERCNDMVTSWILNSLSKDLSDSLQFVINAKELWDELEARYDQTNGARLYQLQQEINNLTQGTLDITGYYTNARRLWEGMSALDANT
ncbi:putative filament-like plant protein 6-like [Capsicum annuum]|nr:putative filament-like plant protein 6-like [Capsicum annuum]